MFRIGFAGSHLTPEHIRGLEDLHRRCAGDIVLMTTLAGSGHPGGSLSSLHALLTVYANVRHDPARPLDADRDRVFVSHGHISPGTYSVLGAYGYFDREEALLGFRRFGSPFGGHVEIGVPGVEWNTGNLGQGLSAGVGAALAGQLHGRDFRTIVCMGDGEQQKGQISEARRTAVKYSLDRLVAIVDYNGLQIGGRTSDVMPQDIAAGWRADGWNVWEVDGHDWSALYKALRRAYLGETPEPGRPTAIIARTVMGHGIPFIENDAAYHGSTLTSDQARRALQGLGVPDALDELQSRRKALPKGEMRHSFPEAPLPAIEVGAPVVYPPEKDGKAAYTDNRSAYGRAMADLARLNNAGGARRIVAVSCDLEGSVKLSDFRRVDPEAFIEAGIQEHNAATMAGRLSREGFSAFVSTFGVFAVTEVFNQQRLNDYNATNVKVVATHCGLDVGEDGPTHQCIDYIGLLTSTFGFEVFLPADPNQTDRIVRAIAGRPGNQFVGMGRSKMPLVTREDGSPFYDGAYRFLPGKADRLREGGAAAILACGPIVGEALAAREILAREGIQVEVWNHASVKPLDAEAVRAAARTGLVLTAEDHHVDTGLGSHVSNLVAEEGLPCRVVRAGVSGFCGSGKPSELYAAMGLDAEGLARRLRSALGA
ncbi:transketolase [Myxococcota bacterium]|nr:transketolase [Myxococcota bacterium]